MTITKFRNALNIATLSAFLTYVGAGLDGQAGLGDFNLQMNDNYQGQVIKGCPTYEQGMYCHSNLEQSTARKLTVHLLRS
jgi:hypothetical protein